MRRFVGCWLLVCLLGNMPIMANEVALTHKVKAAVLYKMIKYITWPQNELTQGEGTFVIGVVGTDPMQKALMALSGQKVNERKIEIRYFDRIPSDCDTCWILFVCQSEMIRVKNIGKQLSGSHLWVSDVEGFAQAGGMVYLYQADDRVRFMINLESMNRVGFKVDSRLLKIAKIVKSEP